MDSPGISTSSGPIFPRTAHGSAAKEKAGSGAYYLDGLVPLAYLSNDVELIGKARKWVNWTLEHQREDGFIGPEKNQDWWPDMIMLKVLTQYQEATDDPRVIPVLEKFFAYQARSLATEPAQEVGHLSVGRRDLQHPLALQSRRRCEAARSRPRHSGQGYDWKKQFEVFRYTEKVTKRRRQTWKTTA